jgi:tetratricopeptide (TPR) repeat protein
VPLQFLAGTGLVGLALLLAFLAAGVVAVARGLRRRDGAERAAAAALATLPAVWLLQSLVDYPWDFVEVTGPAILAVGVLAAAAGGAPRSRAGPFAAAGVVAVTLAAAATVATPWLADRSVRQVNVELGRGDLKAAEDAAARARSLDPLSLAPVFARARVEEARRDDDAALEAYRDAVRLQRDNPETWYALGLFEFQLGKRCSAYVHLNEAYTLDPAGRQWVEGGPLDQARDWVNEPGNC